MCRCVAQAAAAAGACHLWLAGNFLEDVLRRAGPELQYLENFTATGSPSIGRGDMQTPLLKATQQRNTAATRNSGPCATKLLVTTPSPYPHPCTPERAQKAVFEARRTAGRAVQPTCVYCQSSEAPVTPACSCSCLVLRHPHHTSTHEAPYAAPPACNRP